MLFYVIEIQSNESGACIPVVFTERDQAESKYHDVLKYAAVSSVRKHGAILCNEDGFIIKSEVYNHEVPAPEDV